MSRYASRLVVMATRTRDKDMERKGVHTPADANYTHYLSGKSVRKWLLSEGIYPEQLPNPTKSYRQIVREEAERFRIEEENERGLWGQLSDGGVS